MLRSRSSSRQSSRGLQIGPSWSTSALPPKADIAESNWDVRFGSKADIEARPFNVRFTPKSGHCRATVGCLLCATSGCEQSQQVALFNHLVGALLEEQRNIEAERLGGLGVDGHLKFGRQLDRKLRRLCATENVIDVGC